MTGEEAGYAMEKIFLEGALDVYYTPIYMKKNRPAYKLSALSNKENLEKIKKSMIINTSTIGLRIYKVDRERMERRVDEVKLGDQRARIKVSRYEDIIKIKPEYEDCRRIALEENISLREIYDKIKSMYK